MDGVIQNITVKCVCLHNAQNADIVQLPAGTTVNKLIKMCKQAWQIADEQELTLTIEGTTTSLPPNATLAAARVGDNTVLLANIVVTNLRVACEGYPEQVYRRLNGDTRIHELVDSYKHQVEATSLFTTIVLADAGVSVDQNATLAEAGLCNKAVLTLIPQHEQLFTATAQRQYAPPPERQRLSIQGGSAPTPAPPAPRGLATTARTRILYIGVVSALITGALFVVLLVGWPLLSNFRNIAATNDSAELAHNKEIDRQAATTISAITNNATSKTLSETIAVAVDVVPQPSFSPSAQQVSALRVRLDNTTAERVTLSVVVTASDAFQFVPLDGELNQTIASDARSITQSDVVVDPKVRDVPSYRVVFLGFTSVSTVAVGTHQMDVEVYTNDGRSITTHAQFNVTSQ